MLARPSLPNFDYVRATAPHEVVHLLGEHRDAVRLMMGGTDLLVRMREGSILPRIVVDVKHLPGMQDVRYDHADGLTIGAAATMNQVAAHPDVCSRYPVLAGAAESVASFQVRNRATLGGNLCNASPCADTAPAALVLGARMVAYGPRGVREIPANDFFVGPGRTGLAQDEFLMAMRYPIQPDDCAGRYMKLGRNREGDLALVGVAVIGYHDGSVASGYHFRIGLASVAPVPLLAAEAERILCANTPGEEAFALAAEAAMRIATPIADVRSGTDYQKAMVRALTLRGLRAVHDELTGGA